MFIDFSRQEYWSGLPFSRGSSQPRDQTQVSCIAGRFFTIRTIREALCSLARDKNLNQTLKSQSYKFIFLVTRKTGLMKNPSFLLKRNFKHTVFSWWFGIVTKSFVMCSVSCIQFLCDCMDCSQPACSVHGIFPARIWEWVAISFSRGSSPPRD